MNLRKLKF